MTHETQRMPVVIVGAGNLGGLLADCLEDDPLWAPTAFIDDGKAGKTIRDLPILGVDSFDPQLTRNAFLAIGFPEERRCFKTRLDPLGLNWQTFVDRRAVVSRSARIGAGSLILSFAMVASSARIGSFVYAAPYSGIGAGATIGDFVSVLSRASVGGCTVGDGCLLGHNCACSDGADLGDDVAVAPFTWVRRPVPAQSLVAGSPARIVRRHGSTGIPKQRRPRVS